MFALPCRNKYLGHLPRPRVYIGSSKSTTVINGKLNTSELNATNIKSIISQIAVVEAQTIEATSLKFSSTGTSSGPYTSVRELIDAYKIVKTGNDYKLQYKRLNSTEWYDAPDSETFSRATTLSGAWSSGTYTVSASPQGNTQTTSLTITNVHQGDPTPQGSTEDAKHMYATVSATIGTSATVYDTGKSIDINASDIYDDGYDSGYSSGAGSVTVSGSWSSGVFTATTSGGNSVTTSLTITNVHQGDPTPQGSTEDAKHMYATVSATIGSSATVEDTGKSIDINASDVWIDGFNDNTTVAKHNLYICGSNNYPVSSQLLGRGGSLKIWPAFQKYVHTGYADADLVWGDPITISAPTGTSITMTRGTYSSTQHTYECTCTLSETIATSSTFTLYFMQ